MEPKQTPAKNFLNAPEWNCLTLSIAFFILYTAYNSIRIYATSWDAFIGSTSMGLIYSLCCVSSPIVPTIAKKLNFKYSLLLSCIVFCNFILGYYVDNYAYIVFSSILLGVFNSILWTSQSALLTQCSNVYEYQNNIAFYSVIGWFKGVFFSIWSLNLTVACLFSALYWQFSSNASDSQFFFICIIIGSTSCLFILMLRSMSESEMIQDAKCETYASNTDDIDTHAYEVVGDSAENNSILHEIHSELFVFFAVWRNRNFYCLIPYTLYYGLLLEYYYGEFPTFIDNTYDKFYVVGCSGICAVLSTYICGRLVDAYNASMLIVVISSLVMSLLWIVLLYYELCGFGDNYNINNDNDGDNALYVWMTIACVFGAFGPVLTQQQLAILYAKILGNQPAFFANNVFVFSIATAISFFLHAYISMVAKIIVCIIFCVLGTAFLFVNPVNRKSIL